MRRSKNTRWLVVFLMALGAVAAGIAFPQPNQWIGLILIAIIPGWNIYAYLANKEMHAFGEAANMSKGVEHERRKFTFWLSIAAYVGFLSVYVWQYFR
jgi:putative Mn2+ efflux pump MntP